MRKLFNMIFRSALCAAALLAGGCSKSTPQPPKPLTAEQAPKNIGDTFSSASGPAKEMASDAASAMASKNYPQAMETLQYLSARTDLTPEQQQSTARSLQAVNKELSEAASRGDKEAEKALQKYRATK